VLVWRTFRFGSHAWYWKDASDVTFISELSRYGNTLGKRKAVIPAIQLLHGLACLRDDCHLCTLNMTRFGNRQVWKVECLLLALGA
jgi:hypothetical protein